MRNAGEEEDPQWCTSTLFPGLFRICSLCIHPTNRQLIVRGYKGVLKCRDGVTLEKKYNVQTDIGYRRMKGNNQLFPSRVQKTVWGRQQRLVQDLSRVKATTKYLHHICVAVWDGMNAGKV